MEHEEALTSAVFNQRSTKILTTTAHGVHVWNASSFTEELVIPYEGDGQLANAAWRENLSLGIQNVMASDGSTVVVWSWRRAKNCCAWIMVMSR